MMDRAVLTARASRAAETVLASRAVHRVLSQGGAPLPTTVRRTMEAEMNHDFSRIQVHSGDQAATSASSIGAAAYTVGRHVVFGRGQYEPYGTAGRRLLRHELVHTIQQGQLPAPTRDLLVGPTGDEHERQALADRPERAAGPVLSTPVLQRQSDPGTKDESVDSILAGYETVAGHKAPEWLKEWARKYELARRDVPEVPPLSVEILTQAAEMRRIHGSEPPLPHREAPLKLNPGAVAANEVIPFAKGTRVRITQLLRNVLTEAQGLLEKFKDRLDPQAVELAQLLIDPTVTASLDATIVDSTATLVAANIAVPEIPATAKHEGIKGREIELKLEATDPSGKFMLSLNWHSGSATFDVTARRSSKGEIVISAAVVGQAVDVALSRSGGGVVASSDNPVARFLAGGQRLQLVRVDPLTQPAGTEAATKERATIAQQAEAGSTRLPSGHELDVAAGAALKPGSPALAAGWRFNYRVLGDFVSVPMSVQLDYVPGTGQSPSLATGSVGGGAQLGFPVGNVPMTASLVVGGRFGAAGLGGPAPVPVAGPTGGLRASVDVSRHLRVYVQADYFKNVVSAASQGKQVSDTTTVEAGVTFRF